MLPPQHEQFDSLYNISLIGAVLTMNAFVCLVSVLIITATSFSPELREQNETLKIYVDHLVARVMEECPEALCAGAASAAIVLATR